MARKKQTPAQIERKKQLKRLQSAVKRAEKAGYKFDTSPIPENATTKRLKNITSTDIRKQSYRITEEGQREYYSPFKARQEAARKAQETIRQKSKASKQYAVDLAEKRAYALEQAQVGAAQKRYYQAHDKVKELEKKYAYDLTPSNFSEAPKELQKAKEKEFTAHSKYGQALDKAEPRRAKRSAQLIQEAADKIRETEKLKEELEEFDKKLEEFNQKSETIERTEYPESEPEEYDESYDEYYPEPEPEEYPDYATTPEPEPSNIISPEDVKPEYQPVYDNSGHFTGYVDPESGEFFELPEDQVGRPLTQEEIKEKLNDGTWEEAGNVILDESSNPVYEYNDTTGNYEPYTPDYEDYNPYIANEDNADVAETLKQRIAACGGSETGRLIQEEYNNAIAREGEKEFYERVKNDVTYIVEQIDIITYESDGEVVIECAEVIIAILRNEPQLSFATQNRIAEAVNADQREARRKYDRERKARSRARHRAELIKTFGGDI